MKLYYCSECKRYQRRAFVTFEWSGEYDIVSDLIAGVDEPEYQPGDGCKVSHPRCKGGCELEMTIIELDACPHNWQTRKHNSNERYCALCQVTQKGRVVFDER
jgi:hypothetical protein